MGFNTPRGDLRAHGVTAEVVCLYQTVMQHCVLNECDRPTQKTLVGGVSWFYKLLNETDC